MSDPRTLRRSISGRSRPSAWNRLPLLMEDEPAAGDRPRLQSPRAPRDERARRPSVADRPPAPPTPQAPPVFHPLAYRGVVAGWPLESRERWGRRANELEDAGLSWRDAETQAFVEIWRSLRRNP